MKKKICQFILHLIGWKINITIPEVKKYVICVAPHTSNWDFIIGKIGYVATGRHAGFLIKKDWFFFPFNLILSSMGGVPVDRSKNTKMVDIVTDMFNKNDEFAIAVTPEGTRKKNANWKKGFYHIALKAKVPIALTYIDYKKKEIGITELYTPVGDEIEDMRHVVEFFKDVNPRHPELFALPRIND